MKTFRCSCETENGYPWANVYADTDEQALESFKRSVPEGFNFRVTEFTFHAEA